MPDLMYFQYGAYQHPPGEVNLTRMEIIPRFNNRGQRFAALNRLHIVGEIQEIGQKDLSAKIAVLINAYVSNGFSAGWYESDGTPTRHFLDQNQANNMSGVRVFRREWPRGAGDEYATVRTFYIVLEALFYEPQSELMEFNEEIRAIGTGGPLWESIISTTGPVTSQILAQQTPQRLIQTGYVIGGAGYHVAVPSPLFPAWEHGPRRLQRPRQPRFYGKLHRGYRFDWRYDMEAPTAQTVAPNIL